MPDTKRIVIAGGGRIGLRTTQELADRGYEIVLIEKEEARSEAVADEYVAMVLQGDATAPSILEQADLERADAIAALTDEPGTNLAICMEAKRIAPHIRTLARTGTGTEDEYDEIADATILPQELSANTAADILSGDEVRTIIGTHHDLEILEIKVAEDAPVAGHTLAEISLPKGSLVISDRNRTQICCRLRLKSQRSSPGTRITEPGGVRRSEGRHPAGRRNSAPGQGSSMYCRPTRTAYPLRTRTITVYPDQ